MSIGALVVVTSLVLASTAAAVLILERRAASDDDPLSRRRHPVRAGPGRLRVGGRVSDAGPIVYTIGYTAPPRLTHWEANAQVTRGRPCET